VLGLGAVRVRCQAYKLSKDKQGFGAVRVLNKQARVWLCVGAKQDR
jgi:hypothetical protein